VNAIQNDALEVPGAIVLGSRGWRVPGSPGFDEDSDRRVYERELGRLELSLASAMKMSAGSKKPLIAMMHYPPVVEGQATEFARMLAGARVSACVYGHLHLQDEWPEGLDCEIDGVTYLLVSCDYTGFAPVRVPLTDAG
jgi:predicted phosphohydrolase